VEQSRNRLEQEGIQRKRELDSYFQTRQNEQLDVARTIGRLSPAACWTYAAVSLAGTGPAAYERFKQARALLDKQFSDYVDDLARQAGKTGYREWPKIRQDQIPVFRVNFPGTAEALNSALHDILILAILGVVFFMMAFLFFLRYDVR